MQLHIQISFGNTVIEKVAEDTESDVWKAIAEILPDVDLSAIPGGLVNVEVKELAETTILTLKKRGTFVKQGVEKPSLYVTVSNKIYSLRQSTYPECYLTCVNPESNNYKFYHMMPSLSGIEVSYGRIGAKPGEMFSERRVATPYPTHLYWIRYYEKLSKGYVDQSAIYLGNAIDPAVEPMKQGNPTTPSARLYEQLYSYAHKLVRTTLASQKVTREQVQQCKYHWRQLGARKTVRGFNNQLLRLIAVCPRQVRDINTLLAQSEKDFAAIIEREEELLNAMSVVSSPKTTIKDSTDGFKNADIQVFEATEKQKQEVMSHLSDSLKPQVKNIYRVINREQKERFDQYRSAYKISKVKCFWHGSRNENWLSIIFNGLQLNPNAVITGKMFGKGIYFAPSSAKSWGYTSFRGTRWANGKQNAAFMGLYATAYGNPYDVTAPGQYTQEQLIRLKKNCVHAHAGPYLYNDEIVFYSENAMLLNYIVEFGA